MFLLLLLFYFVHGENVILQPGKPYFIQPPGYPNVQNVAVDRVYDFQTAPGETIFAYCEDYRTVGDSKNPCGALSLTLNDGKDEKTFCALIRKDNVIFKTSSNRLKIHLKVSIPQLFSCVIRTTEPTIPETIEISPANNEIKIQNPENRVPYMDQSWLIKNPNKESFTIECGLSMRDSPICYSERYEITVGSEKNIYCKTGRIYLESKGDVTLRAVFDRLGDGRFDCTFSIQKPSQTFVPPPTRPPPAPVQHKVFLKPNQVQEFTSPGYPYGEESARSDTTYEFETLEGAQIQVYCEDFRIGHEETCDKSAMQFDDGINSAKFCKYASNIFQVSKTNKLKVNMKFESPVSVKCIARTTAEPNTDEIMLEVNDMPYRFLRDSNTAPEPYRHSVYKFKTKPGVRLSIQCDISFRDRNPCSEDLLEINDGSKVQTFCAGKKIVVISQKNYLKARLQLDKFGDETFLCVVQAITGDNPNQHKNVVSEEVDSRERGSTPGRVPMTCDCGRRYWPKETKRIYDGKITREGEYTWMVGIRDHDNYQRCGGSLISKYHVLTAAHCMVDSKARNKNEIWDTVIAIGAYQRTLSQTDVESHKETQFIEVLQNNVFIPEEWWTFNKNYDISILVMEKAAIFGIHVGPVCMPKIAPKLWNTEIKITGWGRTETQEPSELLRETKLFVLDREVCSMDPWMMCAYKNWTATCSGDSGSPFVHWDEDTNRYIQVSLASFVLSNRCAPTITGNSNITYHYNWIESVIKKTKPSIELCVKSQ